MWIWLPLVIITVLVVTVLAAGQLELLKGSPPTDIGVHRGRLKPPSSTENSVSSQAELYPDHPQLEYASIEPIKLRNGDGAATLESIKEAIDEMENAQVVTCEADYLYAQFTSSGLKFVDDAEFWFDADASVVQVRSAARLGRKDFGMNRKHIEAVRTALSAP